MQSRALACWVFLTALVISIVIVVGAFTLPRRQQKSAAEDLITTIITTEPGYFAQIQEDTICIFRYGSRVPFQTLDTPVNTLSEYDRSDLETGITLPSKEALRQFVEDFTS